jgi:hypothetical protein
MGTLLFENLNEDEISPLLHRCPTNTDSSQLIILQLKKKKKGK